FAYTSDKATFKVLMLIYFSARITYFYRTKSFMANYTCNKLYKIALVFFLLLTVSVRAQNIDPKVKRILFLGNSITWQANYVNDVIAYLTVHYPNRHFDYINVGLPSETVSGLSEP